MGEKVKSPYPPAYVARVADPKGDARSAVLVPRNIGLLAVRITFHCDPIEKLEVKFFIETDDGKKGEPVGDPLKTNARGIAQLDFMVPAGRYVCAIERQPETVVTTVSSDRRPFIIPLPVGRQYFDVGESPEFSVDEDESTT